MNYWVLIIFAMILGGVVQWRVRSAFNRYSRVGSMRGLSAAQVARDILDRNGLHDVAVERVRGRLSDHYDPRKKVVRLSDAVYDSTSLAAIGIAAHEAGHALQHGRSYAPFALRNAFAPVMGLGSSLLWPAILGGLFLGIYPLIWLGVIFYALAAAFAVITLPVEFNASRRAMAIIADRGYLSAQEAEGARKVLSAAAMTYLAATLISVLELLYWLSLAQSRD